MDAEWFYAFSNGIMQNTITLKRTLQSVEAGQALILKKGLSVELWKKPNTNTHVFLTLSFESHSAERETF